MEDTTVALGQASAAQAKDVYIAPGWVRGNAQWSSASSLATVRRGRCPHQRWQCLGDRSFGDLAQSLVQVAAILFIEYQGLSGG
jgi:hypothetical protein